jgi:diaminopimelate decarboxylase
MLPEALWPDREAGVPHQDLTRAATRFGTPVYVISMADVAAAAGRLEDAFGPPWLRLYSLKANDLPAITSFLHGRGWAASVVSTGEWQHARAAGVSSESVAFEGLGKTDAQLAFTVEEAAAGRPVRWLAIESAQEAAVLAGLADAAGLGAGERPPLDVLLRLNPEVAPETRPEFAVGARLSKFGMSQGEILRLVQGPSLAGPGLRLRGIHVHVGSDLGDIQAFSRAGVRAAQLLTALRVARPQDCRWLDTIDFGGGFPLPAPGAPGPEAFRDGLIQALDRAGLELPPRPAIEPGRYLVGAAGWLVARVLHTRTAGAQAQQVVLDAGMTELIRPALYGSRHPVHLLRAAATAAGEKAGQADDAHEADDSGDGLLDTALEGPVCESTDTFGRHPLPPLQRGDLVAIGHAGAYAASFTSRYNGRPAPVETVLWPNGMLQRRRRPGRVTPVTSVTPVAPVRPVAPASPPRPLAPTAPTAPTAPGSTAPTPLADSHPPR